MEEQTKRAGHVRKRCFTRAAFRVQTIIKRVVLAVTRARHLMYIKCDRKVRGRFSRGIVYSKGFANWKIYTKHFSRILKFFSFRLSIYSFVFSTCIVLFLFFFSRNGTNYTNFFREKLKLEKVRLKWLIRCRDSVMLSLFRSSDLWSTDFFPLLRFSLDIRFES